MPTELIPPYWTGGPPYPRYSTDEGKHGLSVLDWFAGHAIAGLMGSTVINQEFFAQFTFPEEQLPSTKKRPSKEGPAEHIVVPPTPEQLAMIAYSVAGHMVEVRKNLPIEPKPTPSSETEAPAVPGLPTGPAAIETVTSSAEPPSLKTYVTVGSSQAPQEIP